MQRHHHAQLPTSPRAAPALGRAGHAKKGRHSTVRAVGGLLLVALVVYAAASYLAHHRRLTHAQVEGTCTARLAEAGLDLGGRWPAARRSTYQRMASDLGLRGLHLGGVITQGLLQADLFTTVEAAGSAGSDGAPAAAAGVKPVLRPLEVPVRAVVLPLQDHSATGLIRGSVGAALARRLAARSVWWQDERMYHATIFHASTHIAPVAASAGEVAQEVAAVRGVANAACPLRAVLDRVVVTSSGVIVACWQVLPGGGEPAVLRQQLAHALPRAPGVEQQMVKEPAILHTTIARLLAPALRPSSGQGKEGTPIEEKALARDLAWVAEELTAELCGLTGVFEELWYVEEQDLLALALKGRFKTYPHLLRCQGPPAANTGLS